MMLGSIESMRGLSLIFVMLLAAGCGGSSSQSSNSPPSPPQACEDTANAVAEYGQRCGQDYTTNYNAFVNSAANGDCNNIVAIRDEHQLYSDCIPTFKTLACPSATSTPAIPASCSGQLEHY